MLSIIKKKAKRFFTFLWTASFVFSQISTFAAWRDDEIEVTPCDVAPVPAPDSARLRAELKELRRTVNTKSKEAFILHMTEQRSSASSPEPQSTLEAHGNELKSWLREKVPTMSAVTDFFDFFRAAGLEPVDVLSEIDRVTVTSSMGPVAFFLGCDFSFQDSEKKILLFHRLSLIKPKTRVQQELAKTELWPQRALFQRAEEEVMPFSRRWILEQPGFLRAQNEFDFVVESGLPYEDNVEKWRCIRTASCVVAPKMAPSQTEFYTVVDKPASKYSETYDERLTGDSFLLDPDWTQEESAVTYLDYLTVKQTPHKVINFSDRNIFSVNMNGYANRIQRLLRFNLAGDDLYTIDFSRNSLCSRCVRDLMGAIQKEHLLGEIKELNIEKNRVDVEGLKALLPLLNVESFNYLVAPANFVDLDSLERLRNYAKSREGQKVLSLTRRQLENLDSTLEQLLAKIIIQRSGFDGLPPLLRASHEQFYSGRR